VRGSKSPNDWRINFDSAPAPLEMNGVIYHVHGGMLQAARVILDECGCRAALTKLQDAGYALAIVRHALGACKCSPRRRVSP
jgi:hypothetical protein